MVVTVTVTVTIITLSIVTTSDQLSIPSSLKRRFRAQSDI